MSKGPLLTEQAEEWRRADYEAAAIIAADPIKYPPGSGLAQFARAVLAKPRPPVKRGEQQSLINEEEA